MEKKQTNKIIIAIIVVALIIAIVGGSTFAYWQWISAENTYVNVTVKDSINMTITPTTTQTNVMYPVSDAKCATAAISGSALVKVVNGTGVLARPQFYLKLKIIDKSGNNITETYAQYINYAVIDPDDTDTGTTCANSTVTGSFTTNQTKTADGTTVAGWYNSPIITKLSGTGTDETLATRHPILTSTDAASMSFNVPKDSTVEHTYKFWAWIDDGYTYTNTGNVVSDPLQDAKITVSWSETSQVKQVQ